MLWETYPEIRSMKATTLYVQIRFVRNWKWYFQYYFLLCYAFWGFLFHPLTVSSSTAPRCYACCCSWLLAAGWRTQSTGSLQRNSMPCLFYCWVPLLQWAFIWHMKCEFICREIQTLFLLPLPTYCVMESWMKPIRALTRCIIPGLGFIRTMTISAGTPTTLACWCFMQVCTPLAGKRGSPQVQKRDICRQLLWPLWRWPWPYFWYVFALKLYLRKTAMRCLHCFYAMLSCPLFSVSRIFIPIFGFCLLRQAGFIVT